MWRELDERRFSHKFCAIAELERTDRKGWRVWYGTDVLRIGKMPRLDALDIANKWIIERESDEPN